MNRYNITLERTKVTKVTVTVEADCEQGAMVLASRKIEEMPESKWRDVNTRTRFASVKTKPVGYQYNQAYRHFADIAHSIAEGRDDYTLPKCALAALVAMSHAKGKEGRTRKMWAQAREEMLNCLTDLCRRMDAKGLDYDAVMSNAVEDRGLYKEIECQTPRDTGHMTNLWTDIEPVISMEIGVAA